MERKNLSSVLRPERAVSKHSRLPYSVVMLKNWIICIAAPQEWILLNSCLNCCSWTLDRGLLIANWVKGQAYNPKHQQSCLILYPTPPKHIWKMSIFLLQNRSCFKTLICNYRFIKLKRHCRSVLHSWYSCTLPLSAWIPWQLFCSRLKWKHIYYIFF